ncbi:MAG: choice-of-anchor E domain-containing protein [Phycisphaerales bacterium]|nr:choice-of-anchor E domain-containing protein [Phycisphaerae bacterium]NNF44216.1 choice-of-anchor E domain-containing protein [Phycisphaerales bacterium]NNM27774.1 choice-of-anchor E domain-containing protein [Phycisphaerales bacterium]
MANRRMTTVVVVGALTMLVPAAWAGGPLTETQTLPFGFPLSPGSALLQFDQFDDQGGQRILQRVTVDLAAAIGASVTAENESVIPAPDFALVLAGFLTNDIRDISTFSGFNETYATDGSVAPSDGVPGSGPDFWDFGSVSAMANESSEETTNLAPFIGAGTVDADIFASGGFSILGATDATIVISDFMASGTVTITYEFLSLVGACCLPDGSCVQTTEADCTAMGGTSYASGVECAAADCVAPGGPDRVGCTEKGSLLVFSKVELRWTDGGAVLQDTFLSLTNDHPHDVKVQLYFINGDAPLPADPTTGERAHPGWNWLDNELTLTGNQPTYWSALTGQPAAGGLSPFTALDPGFPPGRPAVDGTGDRVLRGYIVGWAVDRDNQEIRWNHLTGNGTIVSYGGGSGWEYNACAYQVVNDAIAHGATTGTPGVLNLDGTEYAQSFNELLLNFQAVGSVAFSGPRLIASDTDLTLHPVDVDLRQETDGPVTTKASFNVWNMNEVKFSGADRCITCWDQTLLSMYDLPNHFLLQNLQTDHGKARIDGLASQVCDVDFDPGDGLPLGADPRDIVSREAALHGIFARLLTIDGGLDRAASGANLVGMGFQSSVIQYDVLGEPDELTGGRGLFSRTSP